MPGKTTSHQLYIPHGFRSSLGFFSLALSIIVFCLFVGFLADVSVFDEGPVHVLDTRDGGFLRLLNLFYRWRGSGGLFRRVDGLQAVWEALSLPLILLVLPGWLRRASEKQGMRESSLETDVYLVHIPPLAFWGRTGGPEKFPKHYNELGSRW